MYDGYSFKNILSIEGRIRKENCTKYYFYSIVLNALAARTQDNSLPPLYLTDFIKDYFNYQVTLDLADTPITKLEYWLQDLVLMGLIETQTDNGNLAMRITKDGLKAYSEQRFNSISASLYEAKQSRRLSCLAIGLSILSLVISLVVAA